MALHWALTVEGGTLDAVFGFGLILSMVVGQSACVTARTEWRPSEAEALRLDDGTPYLWVEASTCSGRGGWMATAHLSSDAGVVLQGREGGVTLYGRISNVDFFVSRPLSLGWGVSSSLGTPFKVRRVEGDAVELVPAQRDDLVVAGAWRRTVVPCSELRFDRMALGSPRSSTARALRLAPNGRSRVEATVPADTPVSIVREPQANGSVEVVLSDGTRVSGWPAEPPRVLPTESGVRAFGICCWGVPKGAIRRDTHVPLHVTNGVRVEPVGAIDPGVMFGTGTADQGWVPVTLMLDSIRLSRGWTFVIPEADLFPRDGGLARPEGHLKPPTPWPDE